MKFFIIALMTFLSLILNAQTNITIKKNKGDIVNKKVVINYYGKVASKPLLNTAYPKYEINSNNDSSIIKVSVKNIGEQVANILEDTGFIFIEFNNSYKIPDSITPDATNESYFIGVNQISHFTTLLNYKKFIENIKDEFSLRYFYYFRVKYSNENKNKATYLHKIFEIDSLKKDGDLREVNYLKYQEIKKFLILKNVW